MSGCEAVGRTDDDGACAGGEVGTETVVGFRVTAYEGAAVDIEVEGAETIGWIGVGRLIDDGVTSAAMGRDAYGGERSREEEGKRVDGV